MVNTLFTLKIYAKKTKWNIGNHNKSNIFKTQSSCSFNVLTGNMNNKENRQNKPLSTSLSLMKPIILWTLHIFNLRLKCVIDIIQLRYTFLYNGILLNLWIRFLSNETALSLFSSEWSDNVAKYYRNSFINMNITHGHIFNKLHCLPFSGLRQY